MTVTPCRKFAQPERAATAPAGAAIGLVGALMSGNGFFLPVDIPGLA